MSRGLASKKCEPPEEPPFHDVLVVLVAFGIALSVAAVHFTGGTTTATLAGAHQASARFAEDFPDEKPGAVRLTSDRHAAFLELGPQRCGIFISIGACFLTRIVTPRDVLALAREGNGKPPAFPGEIIHSQRHDDEADALAVAAALQAHDRIRKAA
ncbi:hypothetical protein EH240_12855 [Mesorhizobium tamadayense]|uniref:Uncharacterized protein n=1 Tax=Mesorhizobium tamadayense TaxID=425306 RepID=A0A3P3FUT9_9HYPH|nr:hypothetical protein EH240_12855 [Mesorhizobium tamadayense]